MLHTPTFWIVLVGSVFIYWLIAPRWRMSFLATVSFGYLATVDPLSVCVLIAWIFAFYYLAPYATGTKTKHRLILYGLVGAILGYLACFKYLPPIANAFRDQPSTVQLVVPLGISYFTFKLIHYAMEVHSGSIKNPRLEDIFCYMYLFPIFSAGPIERFDHFIVNREDHWDVSSTVEGLTRIVDGLIKKYVIAEIVVIRLLRHISPDTTTLLESLTEISTIDVWGYCTLSFLYIYMDFSAYSDIAIGASRLFGIRIMENFNWPIFARNIGEFWQRWHMTLSGWCRGYVYMPMIGLTRNPYLAAYCTFVAIGVWHAGSLHWLFWGLYHGTGVSIYFVWLQIKRKKKWMSIDRGRLRWIGIPITMLFVFAGSSFTLTYGYGGLYDSFRVLGKLVMLDLP